VERGVFVAVGKFLADVAQRFARVVRFWNDGPVATDDDVRRVIRLFAEDPWATRPVEERHADLSEPVIRMRLLFFGPPVEGVTTVDSGSILPGAGVQLLPEGGYVLSMPEATTALRVPDGWLDDGRRAPMETAPEDYITSLEQNRKSVGAALAELAEGRRRVTETWSRELYRRCVVPFSVYDPTVDTKARLWINGVEACLAQAFVDFLSEPRLHGRLRRCRLESCERFIFSIPGAVGRPGRSCCDAHRWAASR
jgi:hypothetical protein